MGKAFISPTFQIPLYTAEVAVWHSYVMISVPILMNLKFLALIVRQSGFRKPLEIPSLCPPVANKTYGKYEAKYTLLKEVLIQALCFSYTYIWLKIQTRIHSSSSAGIIP